MGEITTELLALNGVGKRYGDNWALRDVALSCGPGVVGLLGPNGAGKTTLLRILATILRPDAGAARVAGYDALREPERVRAAIGYLPQEFGVYPELRCAEFLDYFALVRGYRSRTARGAMIERALAETGLWAERGRRLGTFSGGMRRRLGIAQALLGEPRVLIVDEPSAGLDPEERIRLRVLLARLGREEGRLVLLSTHIVPDVAHSVAMLAVLAHGRLVFWGPPADLVRQAEGRAWEAELAPAECAALRERSHVVELGEGSRLDVVRARVVGDAPPADGHDWRPTVPRLEDAYVLAVAARGTSDGAAAPGGGAGGMGGAEGGGV